MAILDPILPSQTLRASNYTIYVDLPNDAQHMLLVHGYSGAYDLVSRDVGRYVQSLDVKPPKPLYGAWQSERTGEVESPSDQNVALLTRRGYVTQLTRDEERSRFERIVSSFHRMESTRVPTYILMPTYDCNLRCNYCFQDHMRTDTAYRHLLRTVTRAQIDAIVRSFPQIEARHGASVTEASPRNFTLFGGEPLLAQNRPIVEYAIRSMQAAGPVRISAVSNATELDAYRDLLGPTGIRAIQVTIDGPRDLHDARRIYADGSGSFDRIAKNIDLALQRGTYIDVRMNVDRYNFSSLPAIAEFYEQRGWSGNPNFSAYAAHVNRPKADPEKPSTFNAFELREALRELHASHHASRSIGHVDDNVRAALRGIFRQKGSALPLMKASFCGAHNGMYIFDAIGDIYACWEKTGDKNLRVGWITPDGGPEFVSDRLASWRSRTVTSNPTCAQCRYSTYCGGGCAVFAEDLHGTIFGNYCDAFGRRLRTSIADAYQDHCAGVKDVDPAAQELRAL